MLVKTIEQYIASIFPRLGVNKLREIVRLSYEIIKRDHCKITDLLLPTEKINFDNLKTRLLKIRYPVNFATTPKNSFYLPKLELNPLLKADLSTNHIFYPKKIYVEEGLQETSIVDRVKNTFPKAQFLTCPPKVQVGSPDFSHRNETLLVYKERYDFLKMCPCSCMAARCGYNLINLGFGCQFDCEYCFLQQYQNLHAVLFPANIEDFLNKIDSFPFMKGRFSKPRIGSGEFTDSLVFDHLTHYSHELVPFFKNRPHLEFEFKTKSTNIGELLSLGGAENIIVAWSVNSSRITNLVEHFSAPLEERLQAACQVAKAGYSIAFHFDPVIIYEGYEQDYLETINKMEQVLPIDKIKWISIGTLRFSRELKKAIENRFPDNTILDGEFLLDFDGKMRYSDKQRKEVYSHLVPILRKIFPYTQVYLCMEDPNLVKKF